MGKSGILLYIGRRLVALAILLVVLSFIIFSLTYLTPGDPATALLGPNLATPASVAAIKEQYHLNDPFFTQYWYWVKGAVHLNFGNSLQTSLPVAQQIVKRLPISLFLAIYAYVLTFAFGVIPGMAAAVRRGTGVDRFTVGSSIIALSTPAFVSGLFGLYLFSVVMPVFPVAGSGTWFVDELWHMTLPAIALALSIVAVLVRLTRSAMIGVLDQDYITFARARGLGGRRVMVKYALRNALIPIATVSGPLFAALIVGAVIIESTFSIPGVGSLLLQAIEFKDLPMVQGLSLVFAAIIILMNLVSDIAYFAIDPRIRLGRH